ncbi:aldehyde dehydrogenase family protein [Amycolatopsis anabasis]|uniref:aldehyde dehydrogenase family protein n=1 Tax=Amycolatopsis anabasis TaxID=1840409 RepID=UPI00131DABDC|nr:aldehyde dehydrogenase family protein [Amycolatopsis anabasis]
MDVVVLDPLFGGRPAASADRSALNSVFGKPMADIGLAPRLLAQTALNEVRRHADGLPPESEVVIRAAELFATEELEGEAPEQYARRVVLSTGLTAAAVARAVEDVVTQLGALPSTTAAELPATEFGQGFRTRWVPRGKVFAAVLASNHPAPNATWVQALFHGYGVLVRPGGRDPFTPRRLIAALLAAGLSPHKVAFLPCARGVGEFLLKEADRGIVYGGERATAAWRAREPVAVRGPGRAKALLDTDLDDAVTDHLVRSVAFDGGVRCNNLSAVLTTRPVAGVADRLAERLSGLPVLPVTNPDAVLPAVSRDGARQLRGQVDALRAELKDHSGQFYGGDFLVELADGSFALRPLVLSADRPGHSMVGTELPFPFVVVAPWSEQDGVGPLSDSLTLNLLTGREDLVERAVRETGVRKITRGLVPPWATAPGIPHDDNFTQFLLEPKGVVSKSHSTSEQ